MSPHAAGPRPYETCADISTPRQSVGLASGVFKKIPWGASCTPKNKPLPMMCAFLSSWVARVNFDFEVTVLAILACSLAVTCSA
jgi:hypothetical protein